MKIAYRYNKVFQIQAIISEFEQTCIHLNKYEKSEDYDGVGDAYLTLSSLLRNIYPALSLSLLRTGEVIMQDNERIDKLIFIRIFIIDAYLVLSSVCMCNGREEWGKAFYKAASDMYDTVDVYLTHNKIMKFKEKLRLRHEALNAFTINIKPICRCSNRVKRNYTVTKKYILDILEEIAVEEELNCVNQRCQNESFMATGHYAENRYYPMSYSLRDHDKVVLVPIGILMGKLYRGESKYHKICKASLYRSTVKPSERFWERLKMCQLSCLIHNYPLTRIFEEGLIYNGGFRIDKLYIDVESIAQHYGIKTSLMDMTIDKWVAAFFATSKYDNKTDSYFPLSNNSPNGSFYQYETDFINTLGKEIRSIGVQPLERPEYQNGYVYRMGRQSELNREKRIKRTVIVHDSFQNRLVYAYANRGNRLFPKEIATEKINEIVKTRRIHPEALNFIITKYYSNTPQSVIDSYISEQRIVFDDSLPHFSDEEVNTILDTWEKHDSQRILKRIHPPLMFYQI